MAVLYTNRNSDGQLACEDPAAAPDDEAGRRLEELDPNDEGLPGGSFAGSCGGCTLEDEGGAFSIEES